MRHPQDVLFSAIDTSHQPSPNDQHDLAQSEGASEESELFSDNYDLGKKLGSGAFSVVRVAIAKGGGTQISCRATPP